MAPSLACRWSSVGKFPMGRKRDSGAARPRRLRILKGRMINGRSTAFVFGFVLLWAIFPLSAHAYVGPGAGFALVSSFLILLTAFALALFVLLTWPFRMILQVLRSMTAARTSRAKRVIVLGLDGQDPELTEQFMGEGLLPNFERLQQEGCYRRLATTLPAESPVAWSSFQTGCNPGRHRVFDFLVPNRKSYLPELCSARIEPGSRRLKLGKYQIPLGKPKIAFERKSRSFWKILGDHGIFSTILRVPISFPPEKFKGLLLSAMSVPDLKGSQGTFTYFSSDPEEKGKFTGGTQVGVTLRDGVVRSRIIGPENPFRPNRELAIEFQVECSTNGRPAVLKLNGRRHNLPLREFTPWIPLAFATGLGIKVHGMVRFYLKTVEPNFKLYMSPINISPEKPALPISQPAAYSVYLAKTQGRFSTLGLAEDTWALNERVLDEAAFLEQTYLTHQERERMFFDALDKVRRGVVVCVFDITDRLQHMFFRYLEPDHPANAGKDTEIHRDAVKDLYLKMDELVGRVREKIDEDTVLLVMSDHGFKSFKRGVNLNTWLYRNGYLASKASPSGSEWFQDVDWSRTRAYSVGLGGIYLNLRGRESQGTVASGEEAAALKREIMEGLSQLRDRDGVRPIRQVYDAQREYQGPYAAEGPDLIVGFRPGYRVSWTSATGAITTEVIEDNLKSWSGDHCMNPADVPGILFANRRLETETPSIMDLAPTVLDLFGVPIPGYMDGKSLLPS